MRSGRTEPASRIGRDVRQAAPAPSGNAVGITNATLIVGDGTQHLHVAPECECLGAAAPRGRSPPPIAKTAAGCRGVALGAGVAFLAVGVTVAGATSASAAATHKSSARGWVTAGQGPQMAGAISSVDLVRAALIKATLRLAQRQSRPRAAQISQQEVGAPRPPSPGETWRRRTRLAAVAANEASVSPASPASPAIL